MHLYYITSYYDTIPYKHHIDYFSNNMFQTEPSSK